MSVRAKFVVNTITKSMAYVYDSEKRENTPKEMHTIKLFPVADGDNGENKKFWAATPSGSIELGIVNPAAVEEFASRLGQAVYVDFTPAD
jgi:dihydroxyacetone kinase-like predicted kinase